MKVIFSVEANDENELRVYTQATSMWTVLWDFDQYLRNKIKHENLTDEQATVCEAIREKLHDMIYDNNVKLDL